jgi:hypothetical protein
MATPARAVKVAQAQVALRAQLPAARAEALTWAEALVPAQAAWVEALVPAQAAWLETLARAQVVRVEALAPAALLQDRSALRAVDANS